jgi:uncharacterized protein
MTPPPSDEPQAVQPPADLAVEPQFEQSASDELQPAEDVGASTSETSPIDAPEQTPGPEEPQLFANVFQPEPSPPLVRIPHLGHVALLLPLILAAAFVARMAASIAIHFHLGGVSGPDAALNDIHYTLGFILSIYLFTLLGCLIVFPIIWRKSFFAGLQWNGGTALRRVGALIGTGFLCYVLAMVNLILVPGPSNTPIEKIFKEPGAAWLLLVFGITCAPFFEEAFYRGFLLPSLCTAYDWLAERFYQVPRKPLGPDGSPQWSLSAMAIASVVTSVPFAMMHAEQTGNSIDAVLLLGCVSVVLCAVRLVTRSLAASVFVHAFYNFLLFSMMLLGTEGFKHLDKM